MLILDIELNFWIKIEISLMEEVLFLCMYYILIAN